MCENNRKGWKWGPAVGKKCESGKGSPPRLFQEGEGVKQACFLTHQRESIGGGRQYGSGRQADKKAASSRLLDCFAQPPTGPHRDRWSTRRNESLSGRPTTASLRTGSKNR